MDVSSLQFDDEAVSHIVLSLAREAHEFALASGIASSSVDDQLQLVLSILDGHLADLLDVRHVPAGDASCLAAIRVGFSNKGYRLLASAAKDRVASPVN